jgi:hypothetical protein
MPLTATVRYWSGEQSFAAPKGLPSDHPLFPMRMDLEPMTNEAAALGNQVRELLCEDRLSPVEKRDFFSVL